MICLTFYQSFLGSSPISQVHGDNYPPSKPRGGSSAISQAWAPSPSKPHLHGSTSSPSTSIQDWRLWGDRGLSLPGNGRSPLSELAWALQIANVAMSDLFSDQTKYTSSIQFFARLEIMVKTRSFAAWQWWLLSMFALRSWDCQHWRVHTPVYVSIWFQTISVLQSLHKF